MTRTDHCRSRQFYCAFPSAGVEIYTIGFTKKSAREFFDILKGAGIKRLIDIRLHNSSQLAGFTKQDDLAFFLQDICGAEYIHKPILSPTKEIMDGYKKKKITWEEYERRFRSLMNERRVGEILDKGLFDTPTVLLCSEPTPDRCHRRLVAEYLQEKWGDVTIIHL
jgi:uncharacterized protein (DUF488 family)